MALTDAMFDKLEELKSKPTLTDKQNLQRIELQFRMDNYDPTALSNGCMLYLVFIYSYMKYGSQKHKWSKGEGVPKLMRGSRMEKSSFEIIKRVTGQNLYRYKSQLKNDYLKAQLDVINAKVPEDSTKVIDIKTSYSQFDFMKVVKADKISRSNNFQMQGYLAVTGKEYGEVYHVLADFTDEAISEHRNALHKILCPDGVTTEDFLEEWAQAESAMRFAHIPDDERVVFHRVERDEKIIEKIYEKVEFCRAWLQEFESKHHNKVMAQSAQWEKELSLKLPPKLGAE